MAKEDKASGKTTKHTCNGGNGPVFGRKTPGCSRCNELLMGAAPVVWASTRRRKEEAETLVAIRQHDCAKSGCASVCTAFQW